MAYRLDIVIFGASGFTGRQIVPRLYQILKEEKLDLTWGIAGRSKSKLKEVLVEAEQKIGENLNHVRIIEADINNAESLRNMTAQAKVLINNVGPFRLFGEQVVQACLETSTHHLDISGEPQFIEEMQYKYHKLAMEKGVYIISACGMDCLPTDLGVIFLQDNFDGTVNSIESYHYEVEKGGPHPGPEVNYATWVSAVYGMGNVKELSELRKKLFAKRLPKCSPPPPKRKEIHMNEELGRWCLPYPGADRSVITRTQRCLYETYGKRPVHIRCYWAFEMLSSILSAIFLSPTFLLFCKTEPTRKLLLKYPGFFSGGAFTTGSPSDEKRESEMFFIRLNGEGWSEKPEDVCQNFDHPPNKKMVVMISGEDPGYAMTTTTASLAAITLLTEKDKLPNEGGCYPPGFAFANTQIIAKLNKHGVKFEIISKM